MGVLDWVYCSDNQLIRDFRPPQYFHQKSSFDVVETAFLMKILRGPKFLKKQTNLSQLKIICYFRLHFFQNYKKRKNAKPPTNPSF